MVAADGSHCQACGPARSAGFRNGVPATTDASPLPWSAMDETPAAPDRARANRGALFRLVLILGLGGLVVTGVAAWKLTSETEWKRSGPPATVDAWAPYWQTESALASFSEHTDVFRDLSFFAFRATAADSVTPYDSVDMSAAALYRNVARSRGIAFTASIIDETPSGTMALILADPPTRAVHVATIVQFASDGGYDGIDLDYEKFAFSDGRDTWTTTRPNWVSFVTELTTALHAVGKTLTVSVPPVYDDGQTSDSGYWVYDYAAMGQVVDHIRIMAYDYSTSSPGPIAPIQWVTDLVKAAKELVPAEKLILGVPVYGYDWVVSVTGVCPGTPDDAPKRRNVSTKSAAAIAASQGIVPTFVEASAESSFSYTEVLAGLDASGTPVSCTVERTVWYADARAVHARAYLAERQDLAGISIWSLGSDDAAVWDAIDAARADKAVWSDVAPTTIATTVAPAVDPAATSTTVAPPTP